MSDCVVLLSKNTVEYFKDGSLSKSNTYCQHNRVITQSNGIYFCLLPQLRQKEMALFCHNETSEQN